MRGPCGSHARLRHIQLQYAPHLSSTPHKVSALSWRIIRKPSRRDDSRGHIREPQYLFPKEPTLERSRFRSGPRQTASNLLELPYQVTLPEFHDWALKVFHAAADFSRDLVHAHDQHKGDCDIQAIFGRKATTKTITPRVAQPTSTSTIQPSLHYVKDGRAKNARRHESLRQLSRNSRAKFSLYLHGKPLGE